MADYHLSPLSGGPVAPPPVAAAQPRPTPIVLNNDPPGQSPQLPANAGPLSQFGGTALQGVDPNAQVSTQLATLMNSGSPLEQLAASLGMNDAAARGSANGTLFAGASMAELNKNLTPIAQADAAQEAQRVAANQQAINQQNVANTQANAEMSAATSSAGISANASMANAQLAAKTQEDALKLQSQTLQQNHDEFLTNWDNQFKMATQSQQFQQASQQAQNEFTAKYNAFTTSLQTIMSDPSYWADPQSSMGMMNFYNQNLDQLLDGLGLGTGTPSGSIPGATGP